MSIFGTLQTGHNGQVNSNTTLTASTVNTALTNLIVVGAEWGASGTGTCSVSDSAGNSYSTSGTVTTLAAQSQQFFYCLSATHASATNGVQMSLSGSSGISYTLIYVWNFTIVSGAPLFDIDTGTFNNVGSATPTTPSYNTGGSDEVVCVYASNLTGSLTYAAQVSPPYTLDNSNILNGNAGSEHIIFSSPQSSITSSMTMSGSGASSAHWIIRAIGFMAAGSGSGIANGLALTGYGH